MLPRPKTLTLSLAISAAMSACARGPGVAGSAETAAVSATTSRISDLPTAPATRRLYSANVWVNEELRPSPDGRYVSMTDWSTGNLVLRNLATDATVELSHKGSWATSDDFAETSTISPDGKSIAYGWYSDSASKFDVRVTSLAGPDSGRTRVIYQGKKAAFTAAQAWTPDSRNVVTVIQDGDRTTHIALVPAFGGKSSRLKSFDWRYPNDISVSPDGKWLAYDFPPEERSGDRDVFLLALDGSAESVVSKENGDDFVVGWTRDGSRVLYGSEKGGTPGVWAVSVVNGKPTGSPVLVRSDMWRMVPLGATKTGRVVYQVNTGTRDVFTAALDPKTGDVASKPAAMNSPSNITFALSWSPDGQHMAQVVPRSRGTRAYGPSDIIIRSIEQGEMRRLSPQMSRITGVNWPSNGSGLLVRGADTKGQDGIFAVDLETAKMRPIVENPVSNIGRSLTLAPGGKMAYFVGTDSSSRKSHITRLDLGTGAMQVLYTVDTPQFVNGMAASPDGRQLAIGIRGGKSRRGIIVLLPVTGGTPREIYRFSESEAVFFPSGFSWRERGELIFGVGQASDSSNSKIDLRALSLSDGTLRSLHVPPARISGVRMSPDGRRIAYIVNDVSAELWTMEEPAFDLKKAVADRH